MSQDDLRSWGQTLGIAQIDNANSIKYYGSGFTGCAGGNGICNNNIFPVVNNKTTANAGSINYTDQPFLGAQGTLMYNNGLQSRSFSSGLGLGSVTASPTVPNVYGVSGGLSLMNQTHINNEFKNNFQILATNYMVWYDTAIVRLKDICDYVGKMPLVKNLDMLIRLYVNTGVCGISQGGNTVASGLCSMNGGNTTFTNTCPFTINNIGNLVSGAVPATNATTVAGLFLSKAPTTSMLGVNLGLSLAQHPMNSCRLYFSQIKIKPELELKYVQENRAKKILYKNVLYQNLQNITAGSSFSQLVQSGVRRITGVLLIPYMSASTHGLNTVNTVVSTPFHPAVSPFDTAPVTTPMSITQLQIQIGGKNQLENFYNYTYENYIQQVNDYSKVNGSALGLSNGLISQQAWENGYRYYFVDCSRYTNATACEPRNVAVSFVNNTLQTIDVVCYVEYLDEQILDVETGRLA